MARVAKRLGVEIRLDEPVEEILFAGKRAVGVRTAQGTHRADAVVVNADFARAMERLVPDQLRRRWTNRKLAKKKYSCSTFMMYLGVEGKFDLPHHTIHIAEDYAKNLEDIEDRHVLSDDPSFYVQNACVTDPSLAPRGHSTLYVLAPVTHQHPNVDWSKERTRYRELLLRQIRKAGYDLDPSRIRYERVITPADWDTRYEIYRGATFNLAHSLDQMLHLRPHNRFEDLERRLPGRRRHASGQRPAGDFRERAHQQQAAARRPRHEQSIARRLRCGRTATLGEPRRRGGDRSHRKPFPACSI